MRPSRHAIDVGHRLRRREIRALRMHGVDRLIGIELEGFRESRVQEIEEEVQRDSETRIFTRTDLSGGVARTQRSPMGGTQRYRDSRRLTTHAGT